MTEEPDRRTQWEPPPRPDWVQRINEEGDCMDIVAVVPLDADSLIASAQRSTGLSDFGDEDWREPFEILCRAMDDEAQLNLIGRLRTRSELLQLLCARLQIEDEYKRHPEIDDEQIRDPLFIIGPPRSGTSLLINLLAANPDSGVAKTWEVIFPSPPPEAATYATDPRIERGHELIDQWNRVTPTMPSIHEFAGDIPLECCQILGLSFRSSTWFDALGQVPSYQAYLAEQDIRIGLRYHKRLLKLLQWRNPRRHWVLKDPMHLDRMREILDVYPDARFVWTHRDPVRALASLINMLGTVQWGRSDHPFQNGAFEYISDPAFTAGRFEAAIDLVESGVVPRDRVFDVLYADLLDDTIGTIQRMYASFGLELSAAGRAGMERYLAEHPREARPAHAVPSASEEVDSHERRAFKRYQEHFGIPNE